MTTESKKPSERIGDACSLMACERKWSGLLPGGQDWCDAVETYLDEEHARRLAWEKSVEERLERLGLAP